VVVFTLVAMGLQTPPAATSQVPAGEPKPQSASSTQLAVQPPAATTQVAGAVHCALPAHAFWNTPIGPGTRTPRSRRRSRR
jgi:hypothetical protein